MHADRNRLRPQPMRLFEVVVIAAFISIVAFCAYDGFKEIFTKPVPFKPKQAEDSIAELKATIAKSKDISKPHKYVKASQADRRSALSTDTPPPPPKVYVLEPILEAEEEHRYPKVTMVSAMQEAPCAADGGDELHYLSVKNKQDYARLHGYDFVLGIKQVDPQLENMWNKPAWLVKTLEDEDRQGEWILWVDIDTVIIDANFTLPFDEYAAKTKDLIVYGNLTEVKAGHPVKALNTGVMLVRNTPWARHFFSEVARLGRLDDHHKGKNTLSQILLKELQADAYSDGLRDQNAVIYLLKTHPEWHDRVAFLDKEICLNCYWRDLIGVTGYGKPDYDRLENVSFVQHFMGCQTCNAQNRNGDLDSCRDGMFHSFKFVESYHKPMLASARPRTGDDLAQLRELPFCSFNSDAEGCKGAKPMERPNSLTVLQYDWKQVDNATVASTLSALKQTQPGSEAAADSKIGREALPENRAESGQSETSAIEGKEENRQKVKRREARAVGGGSQRRQRYKRRARLSQNRGGGQISAEVNIGNAGR